VRCVPPRGPRPSSSATACPTRHTARRQEAASCDAGDVWRCDARAGRTVEVTLDSAGDAVAASCSDVVRGGLELAGDDEVPCSTPSFRCPGVRPVATTDSHCVVTVRTCAGGCVDASMARDPAPSEIP
jgi:hypothetical protein